MIARIWRGRTSAERADGVPTFRDDRGSVAGFMTISYWDGDEAMAAFAGNDDPTAVRHLGRDEELLIELPRAVQILRLLTSQGRIG